VPLIEPEDAVAASLGQLTLLIGLDEAVIAGPGPDPGARELPADVAAIRVHVRADDRGNYRPLSGLRNLPSNWHARFTSLEAFANAVDAVYPLAQRHAALLAEGSLVVVPLDAVFERQAGRYAVAARLSAAGRDRAVRMLCGACVRSPLWAGQPASEEGAIPCPEPCSVMLALCREAALWEQDRPAAAEPCAGVPFAAFDQPGNHLREAYLRSMEPAQ
jgi:hypothetical protein